MAMHAFEVCFPRIREAARGLLEGITSDLKRLQRAIDVKDPERTSVRVSNALERLSQIELTAESGTQVPGAGPVRLLTSLDRPGDS